MVKLTQISQWLYRATSGWVAVAATVIFLLFTALVLPGQSSRSVESSQAPTPDLSFYYSPGSLYQIASALGEDGRAAYIRARFTFDLVWPLVYTFFLTSTITWSFRAFSQGSWMRNANMIPILAILFDYLENISTSLVMYRFPDRTPVVDFLAPIFTSTKWVLVGGSFAALILGTGYNIWLWAQKSTETRRNK
jgi:hypothetical protein